MRSHYLLSVVSVLVLTINTSFGYLPDFCDSNCKICQNEDDLANQHCSQCETDYFLKNSNGLQGCLNCNDEFGDECNFCADGIGCQQCQNDYTRVEDEISSLFYCQCVTNCNNDIITFEDLSDEVSSSGTFFVSVPDGYYRLYWDSDTYVVSISALVSLDPFFVGAQLLNNDQDTYGYYAAGPSVGSHNFEFGSSGGRQFRVINFNIVTVTAESATVICTGSLNNVELFSISNTIEENVVSTISIDNDITIDEFSCGTVGSIILLIDNFEIDLSLGSPAGCDDNCQQCQNQNNPSNAFCSQCMNGYFLGDSSGMNGCLSCEELYGDTCKFCANQQGCQQCEQGYTRYKDDATGLHYCE